MKIYCAIEVNNESSLKDFKEFIEKFAKNKRLYFCRTEKDLEQTKSIIPKNA